VSPNKPSKVEKVWAGNLRWFGVESNDELF